MSLLDEEKRFYERFYALHRDAELLAVFEKFGIQVFRRSSVLEGFAAFLEQVRFGGDRCIEIGTCKGLTALVLARRFKEVVSIDVAPDPDKHRIAAFLGIRNVLFVDVADNAEKASVIRRFGFDAAYVDGDHARDTETDFDLVRGCGRVLFHEYWPAQPAVMQLVDELRAGTGRAASGGAGAGNVVTQGKLALWTA